MIFAKINEDFNKFGVLEGHSIIKFEEQQYYIYSSITKEFLDKNFKSNANNFFIGIRIELDEATLKIYEDEIYVFEYSNSIIISKTPFEQVKTTKFNIKEQVLESLLFIVDYTTKDGRNELLKNFIDVKYIPEWLHNEVSSYPSLRFKRTKYIDENQKIDLSSVVGCYNSSYNNSSWLDMYYSLKRGKNIVRALLFPNYYDDLKLKTGKRIGLSFVKFDESTYIDVGSHRAFLSKLKGLNYIYAPMVEYTTDMEYKTCYLSLKEKGCEIDFPLEKIGHINAYENIKESWEVFDVKYKNKAKRLVGIDEIRSFYNELETEANKKENIVTKIKNYLKSINFNY